ncbi:MAG: glycosyltransferase [Halothiobacillaceae bacterium]
MHLVDTLDVGGAERVAVNLVNALPRDRYSLHLCTTRREGPLAELVASDVGRVSLKRRRTVELRALWRLARYVREHDIQLIHAHSTTLLVAVVVSPFGPTPAVIWHVHYGRYATEERPVLPYWLLTRRVAGVIAVNQPLAAWSRDVLKVSQHRVWYIPNFAASPVAQGELPSLPGTTGKRIVCVANLRPEKDHLTLVQAMQRVVVDVPTAHLLVVGAEKDPTYGAMLRQEIAARGLTAQISLLGQRSDVVAILRSCDVGVLSSASEGLPLALLEYGMAGLPAVATTVGQCPEVLGHGEAGLLVPPRSPEQLAAALLSLLTSPERRAALGERFRQRVQRTYGQASVVAQICRVYERVLASR